MSAGNVPAALKTSVVTISNFKGADLTSSEPAVDIGRSPYCPNMIRSSPGKVRKRVGYKSFAQFTGRVNGYHFSDKHQIVHCGTKVYARNSDDEEWRVMPGTWEDAKNEYDSGTPVSDTGVADALSSMVAFPLNNDVATIYFDGVQARCPRGRMYNDQKLTYMVPLTEQAYIPTVMISRDPIGGGVAYEEVNILSDGWTETFYGTASALEYQMSFGDLSEKTVKVEVMADSDENWHTKTEGTDFTVDRTTGIVTFVTAPGVPPIDGTDNVKITAYKDRSELAARVNKCTVCTVYGDTGTGARLFCTGNPDYPNRDFWSALNDPLYFPDLNYSRLGREDSAIVGYSVLGDKLAAHKDEVEGSIYVRSSTFDEDGYQQFIISNVINGRGAIAPRSFAYLGSEPLFLTRQGIYAITTADLTQERYEQSRSFYLNGQMLAESGLEQAYAAIYKDFYALSVGDNLYILDGSTKNYERNEPYSNFQYEGFYFTGINARVIWTYGNVCYFGTDTGEVFEFCSDSHDAASYSDNGNEIYACWQTPAIDGANFYKNKFFRYCAIRLAQHARTGVVPRVRKRGMWESLFSYAQNMNTFDFRLVDFSNFTFRTWTSVYTLSGKIRVGKVDNAVFRFENGTANSAFEPDVISFELFESRNYKGVYK